LIEWEVVESFIIPDSQFLEITWTSETSNSNLFFDVRFVADPTPTPVSIQFSRQTASGKFQVIVNGPPNRAVLIESLLIAQPETYAPITEVRLNGDGSLVYQIPQELIGPYSPLGFRARLTPELIPRDSSQSGPYLYEYQIAHSQTLQEIHSRFFIVGNRNQLVALIGSNNLDSRQWDIISQIRLNADGSQLINLNEPIQAGSSSKFYNILPSEVLEGWEDLTQVIPARYNTGVSDQPATVEMDIFSSRAGWALLEGRSRTSQPWTPIRVLQLNEGPSSWVIEGPVFREYRLK
jgi:hypothetical protein